MSFTSSFLHLDGVEFKISDSLQTPSFEGLSSDFKMKDPSALLLESNYDFTKEKEVLAKIQSLREAEKKMAEQEEKRKHLSMKRRADEQKQRLEEMEAQQRVFLQRQRELFLEQKRLKQQTEGNESNTPDRNSPNEEASTATVSSPTYENVTQEAPPVPPRNPFSQVGKDLLTPQPAARKTQDAATSSPSHSRPNQSQPVVTGQSQIWVDFEDKELDPFTNMELKTIDDMAELQSVLQNVKLEPPKSSDLADYLPSYEEVTAGKTEAKESAVSALEVSPPHPDNETNAEKAPTPATSANSSPETIQSPSNENVKLSDDNHPPAVDSNMPERSGSPEFGMPSSKDGLYQNVSLDKVNDIAKILERPSTRPLKTRNDSVPAYEFAKDPLPSPETDKAAAIRSTFEKNLARKSPEIPQNDQTYAVVRPKIRARKTSPDLSSSPAQPIPVSSGIVQQNPVPPTSNWSVPASTSSYQPNAVPLNYRIPNPASTSSNQSIPVSTGFNSSSPVLTGYMRSHSPILTQSTTLGNQNPVLPKATQFQPHPPGFQAQTGPVLPPPRQINPTVTPKVLPVSFGGVTNSLSTPVLPPITSGTTYPAASVSNPNLPQPPTPMPRRPPVPPRDPIAAVTPPIQPRAVTPHPPQNGATTGHSHLLPPYALPKPNGPSASKSTPAFLTQKSPPLPKKSAATPSSGAETSFIQKSNEDRAKFAETVSKALSSLPQNPKPIVKHKPTTPHENSAKPKSQAFSNYQPLPPKTRNLSLKSSLVAGLSSDEQEFVKKITLMGFDVEATVRAIQKYGLDDKEVVDHLCNVQTIVEQGFSTRTVQDALEMYEKDNKSVYIYLQQATQLIDMGFKEDDVREALKSSKNDQTKALDQLMGQT